MKNIPYTGIELKFYKKDIIHKYPNRRVRRHKLNGVPSSVKIGATSPGTAAPIRSVKQL